MILEFERTDRMGDPFDRITLPMCKVVHRINAPTIACPMVCGSQDAIHYRIPKIDIRRSHIDPRPQRATSVGKLSGTHPLKEIQIFFHRTITKRTIAARFSQRTAELTDLVRLEITNIRIAATNELDRPGIELLKVVRCVASGRPPIKAEPFHVFFDGPYIFLVFFGRVCIVKSKFA